MQYPNMSLRILNAAGERVWNDHIHRRMITVGGLAT